MLPCAAMLPAALLIVVMEMAGPKADGLYSSNGAQRVQAARRLAKTPPEQVAALEPTGFLGCFLTEGQDPEEALARQPRCVRQRKALYHLLNAYGHLAKQEILAGNPYEKACKKTPKQGRSHLGCATHFLEQFCGIGSGGGSLWLALSAEDSELDLNEDTAARILIETYNGIEVKVLSDLDKYAFADRRTFQLGERQFVIATFAASDFSFRRFWVGHQFVFEKGRLLVHRSSLSLEDLKRKRLEESVGGFALFDEVAALHGGSYGIGFDQVLAEGEINRATVFEVSTLKDVCVLKLSREHGHAVFKEALTQGLRVENNQCVMPPTPLGVTIQGSISGG